MIRKHFVTLVFIISGILCSPSIAQDTTPDGATNTNPESTASNSQLFEGMGFYQRKITTASGEAQKYLQQGLIWIYAFNHDEAIRSFLHAAELDPDCAMAWWGVAYCEGPNYNDYVMTGERSKAPWYALQNALARIKNTTPVERALIKALAHRYSNPWPEERTHLEQAYADAMGKVWKLYPDDPDVGVLYADAMMVQKPWKLYHHDQSPAEGTDKIVATLERVMKICPDHPRANHLYIHAVEPSDNPDRGLVATEKLANLVPASGHLLHMPSHIFVKTGH